MDGIIDNKKKVCGREFRITLHMTCGYAVIVNDSLDSMRS